MFSIDFHLWWRILNFVELGFHCQPTRQKTKKETTLKRHSYFKKRSQLFSSQWHFQKLLRLWRKNHYSKCYINSNNTTMNSLFGWKSLTAATRSPRAKAMIEFSTKLIRRAQLSRRNWLFCCFSGRLTTLQSIGIHSKRMKNNIYYIYLETVSKTRSNLEKRTARQQLKRHLPFAISTLSFSRGRFFSSSSIPFRLCIVFALLLLSIESKYCKKQGKEYQNEVKLQNSFAHYR